MKCTKCELYSYGLRRCKRGKANPPTLKGALEAAHWGSLCMRSKWWDKVVEIVKQELVDELERR